MPPVRWGAYKTYVLAVLLFAYTFNFLDRQALSISLEAIKHDLSLTDSQLGLLTGIAFALFYALAGIPVARLADRTNRPLIIASAIGLLSVAVGLCGFVTSFAQLLLVRVAVGIAEAGIVPPAHALLASYFDREQRLRTMSVFLLGGPLSMIIGYLAGGWITELFGWRWTFMAVALPGLVLAIILGLTIRDPARVAPCGRRSGRPPDTDVKPVVSTPQLLAVLLTLTRQPTFRNLLIASVVVYLFGSGLLQWIPVFFLRLHGMSSGELGMWLAINWGLGNALGTFLGGFLTNTRTPDPERRQLRILALIAVLYVPLNIAVLLVPDKHVAMALLFAAALVNALGAAPTFSIIQSLVPQHMRATAVAAIFLFSNLIGLGLGPLLVGIVSDQLSSTYGSNALRIALLACAPGYWWVAAHYLRASRTVMKDLQAVTAAEAQASSRA